MMYDIAESSKNEPTEIENGIDRGYCINGNYKCRYELLFAANGLTSRVVIEYRTNNMPMYDLIKDIEDDIREALEDDSDEGWRLRDCLAVNLWKRMDQMEDKTCKTCKDNEDGLCDRKGILVEDDDSCSKWQPSWKEHYITRFLKVK